EREPAQQWLGHTDRQRRTIVERRDRRAERRALAVGDEVERQHHARRQPLVERDAPGIVDERSDLAGLTFLQGHRWRVDVAVKVRSVEYRLEQSTRDRDVEPRDRD